jgi:hypothetical protein
MCGAMTHDELLAKLAHTPQTDPNGELMHKVLRAVVELHRPQESFFNDMECAECTLVEDITLSISYPCQTIQAIEKEFN